MAKFRSLPLVSTSVEGLVQAGHGIRVPTSGVLDQAIASSQLWVDPNGNDSSGDGSFGNPFLTLTKAFAYIVANPLSDGYVIFVPPIVWQENVGLPPPQTCIVGSSSKGTVLEAVGGGNLTWAQPASQTSELEFRNLTLNANVNGVSGGSLSTLFRNCIVNGTFTLVGYSDWSTCDVLPTFVNCQTVYIYACPGNGANLSLTYDPFSGTNGPGPVGLLVAGGQWGGITYSATASGVPLEVIGARANTVNAQNSATINCRRTRVLTSLTATHVSSVIEYDSPLISLAPVFAGLGSFKLVEFFLSKAIALNAGESDVTIAIPPLLSNYPIPNVFGQSNLKGTSITYVSNTINSLTVHVIPGTLPNPAFNISLLVRP